MFQKFPGDFRVIDKEDDNYRITLFPDDLVGILVPPKKEGLLEVAAYYYNLGYEQGKKENA